MGIIRAAINAVGGGLADQYFESYEAGPMSDTTVMTMGVRTDRNDKRGSNRKGTANTISNGSLIHVYPNQFMMLVDGGQIIDYTAEEGYYEVDNSSMPSLFNGELGDAVKETFRRVAFGGSTPLSQKVYFINTQEIKGIKFGTPNPINYMDEFYNAELWLRAYGYYSIKITDPIKFFFEAIPRNATSVDINDINDQYRSEFLNVLGTALNKMSADGIRISHVASHGVELSKYMSEALDEDWEKKRGFVVQSVGIASISYDEESKKLINMRNQGAMLSDPTIREGYVQGSVARGMEAAGSNANGSMMGFAGMGMGGNVAGGFMGAASSTNAAQMEQQRREAEQKAQQGWSCSCGQTGNTGKFCSNCGKPKPAPAGSWKCPSCGSENIGRFCGECGTKKPEAAKCANCGFVPVDGSAPKFCPECGKPFAG